MNITDLDLKILTQCAIAAALQAGRALKNFSLSNLKIKKKKSDSLAGAVVTEADLRSQEIILSALQPTIDFYDLAILSEESPDDQSRFKKDYFWCIDPLDGTLPFTEGKTGYAVSIALVSKEGQSVIGVVYNPPTDNLWYATRGNGAFKNGNLLTLEREEEKAKGIQFFVDRSFLADSKYAETVQFLNDHPLALENTVSIDHIGGAVMQAIRLLDYEKGSYFKFPRKGNSGGSIWDYAATHCLFSELNLHATDIRGEPMDLNRGDSTFMNHHGILFATDKEINATIHALYQNIAKNP